jgi:hypothetical protein
MTLTPIRALALVVALTAPAAHAATTARAIVFLWDGTQRHHMRQAYDAGHLPTLRALVENGGLLRDDLVINTPLCTAGCGDGYDTETGPANSAIITGCGFPAQANQDNTAPNPIPPGRTFFERVKAAHPEVVTGMITSKHYDFWPITPLSTARAAGKIDWYFMAAPGAANGVATRSTRRASPTTGTSGSRAIKRGPSGTRRSRPSRPRSRRRSSTSSGWTRTSRRPSRRSR